MHLIGVEEAAEYLGVSPRRVRQMLSGGLIHGQRVGRDWVMEKYALRIAAAHRRPAHRPWHPSSAWAVLALADGVEPRCKASERHRAARRLEVGLPNLLGCLASRARKHRLYTHPGSRDRIAVLPGVVHTGACVSPVYGLDIINFGPLEAYVSQSNLLAIRKRFVVEERLDRPNLLLQEVSDDQWPFPDGATIAPPAVVTIDLLESDDGRCKRAGAELLQRL